MKHQWLAAMALSTPKDGKISGCGLKSLASDYDQYLLGAKFIVSAMFDITGAAIGAMPSTANTAIPTKSIVVTFDMIASFQEQKEQQVSRQDRRFDLSLSRRFG